MHFEFSAVLDGANCHIRATRSSVIPGEKVLDRPHKHYYMEFHWVSGGEETITLPHEHRRIDLRPGQFLLIPRGVYHGVTTKNTCVDRMCFNFSAEPASEGPSPIMELFRKVERVQLFDGSAANELLRQFSRLTGDGPLVRVRQGTLLLTAALELLGSTDCARELSLQPGTHETRQKWVIEDYIERHYTDTTGMEGLAQTLYLSQRQTRKLVRRFLGEDFKHIIIRRRMELAEIYLYDHRKSLEEIAWQVGYRSYSGFQACFKAYYGLTPSQRRAQLISEEEKDAGF